MGLEADLLLLLLLLEDLRWVLAGAGGPRSRVSRTSNRRISMLLLLLLSRSVRLLEAKKLPRSCNLVLLVLLLVWELVRSKLSLLSSSSSRSSWSWPAYCTLFCDATGEEDESNPPASCSDICVSCRSNMGPKTPVGGAALRSRLFGRELRRT